MGTDKTCCLSTSGDISSTSVSHIVGSVLSRSGSVAEAVKLQCDAKMPQLLKFVAFCTQNVDFPFFIKQKVIKAALLFSILYSYESWFTRSLFPASTLYMDAVKALLGVRRTTPNLLCLLELGLPSLSGKVRDTQLRFIEKLIA